MVRNEEEYLVAAMSLRTQPVNGLFPIHFTLNFLEDHRRTGTLHQQEQALQGVHK